MRRSPSPPYVRTSPNHLRARARVDAILTGRDELVVPALFPIEVTSALARRAAWPQPQIAAYVARLLAPPCRVVTIGMRSARAASQLAAATRLRAADAVYVWLASKEAVLLVSSDQEPRLLRDRSRERRRDDPRCRGCAQGPRPETLTTVRSTRSTPAATRSGPSETGGRGPHRWCS